MDLTAFDICEKSAVVVNCDMAYEEISLAAFATLLSHP
jgi:hypothetical protein